MSRVVLAPEWIAGGNYTIRHEVERGAQGFKLVCVPSNHPAHAYQMLFSDPEALALRDWLNIAFPSE